MGKLCYNVEQYLVMEQTANTNEIRMGCRLIVTINFYCIIILDNLI